MLALIIAYIARTIGRPVAAPITGMAWDFGYVYAGRKHAVQTRNGVPVNPARDFGWYRRSEA